MDLISVCEYFSLQAAVKFIFKILHNESSPGSRKFVIEPETGVITVQGELDRETTANYSVCIQTFSPPYVLYVITWNPPVLNFCTYGLYVISMESAWGTADMCRSFD